MKSLKDKILDAYFYPFREVRDRDYDAGVDTKGKAALSGAICGVTIAAVCVVIFLMWVSIT